jgi:hypothetical protein
MLANPKQTIPQKIAAAGPICFAFFCGASMTANVKSSGTAAERNVEKQNDKQTS